VETVKGEELDVESNGKNNGKREINNESKESDESRDK